MYVPRDGLWSWGEGVWVSGLGGCSSEQAGKRPRVCLEEGKGVAAVG